MADEEKAVSPEGAETTQEEGQTTEGASEQAQQSEEAQGEGTEAEGQPPEPKKQTAQERINEVYRKQKDAEREAAYWRRAALEKEKAEEVKPEESPERHLIPPRPVLDQFDTTQEYEDALLTWHDRKKTVETEAATQRKRQEEAVSTFNQRARELREEYDDFDEVIEAPVFTPIMRAAILHAENGPFIAYHLGLPQNAETARRIRNLPLELQTYEIGKLETQILVAAKTRKPPGAPAPLKPLGMSGGGAEVDTSKMTDQEWFEYEKKQRLEKLRKKYGG